LKQSDNYDNSLIILTGDHGNGLNWVKHSDYSLYEERIRVPLIVKYPDWYNKDYKSKSIVNTNVEIHKIIYNTLGLKLPDHLIALKDYNHYENLAYSETIFNPNNDQFAHSIALMSSGYKYVSWNRVDWRSSKIIEYRTKEKLFSWDKANNIYNENSNLIHDKNQIVQDCQELTMQIMNSNLQCHSIFGPEKY
jgi:arylsulfatase A-like enzyme